VEIFKAKHEQGELSDNLPPGSPLEYIDLSEAHPKYQIERLPEYPSLVENCDNPSQNIQLDHLEQAQKALKKIGLVFTGVS